MNSFSINRFWQMLRWLISVNRVRLLGFTLGIMFSTLLIQLMIFVFGSFDKIVLYLSSCVQFGSFLIPFVIPVTVTWLMIPATNLEKFLSLIVYVTVICGLCAIVGYILGDCLRMASLWIGAQLSADPAMKASEVFNYNGVDGTYYLWSSTVYWVFCDMTPHLLTVWGSGMVRVGILDCLYADSYMGTLVIYPGWHTVTQVYIRRNGFVLDCDCAALHGISPSFQPQRVWKYNAS